MPQLRSRTTTHGRNAAGGLGVHIEDFGGFMTVRLTRREEEVLDGILRSLANKEIANELNLSERTVKFHVSSLLAKFKVRGRLGNSSA